MMKIRHVRSQSAFTLLELLVVIGIIALLTSVLVPSIRMVSRSAKRLKQSSVFHGYRTGLELFSNDFNGYPDSGRLPGSGSTDLVCGAQHLAEALMGIDQRGFDPKSKWYAPGYTTDTTIYASTARGSTAAEVTASDNRRKDVYIEQKDDGCYALADVYSGGSIAPVYSPSGFTQARAPVLTDIFKRKRIKLATPTTPPGVTIPAKVGSPVLYFKADTASKLFMGNDSLGISNHAKWIYNYEDNRAIIDLGTVLEPTVRHRYDQTQNEMVNDIPLNGLQFFYHKITNPGVDAFDKPYNYNTFILMSAGPDGVFGTKDDVTNFQ